jgi:hypothetical protein
MELAQLNQYIIANNIQKCAEKATEKLTYPQFFQTVGLSGWKLVNNARKWSRCTGGRLYQYLGKDDLTMEQQGKCRKVKVLHILVPCQVRSAIGGSWTGPTGFTAGRAWGAFQPKIRGQYRSRGKESFVNGYEPRERGSR